MGTVHREEGKYECDGFWFCQVDIGSGQGTALNSEKGRKAGVNYGFRSFDDDLRYIESGIGKRKDRISVSDGTTKERGTYFAQVWIRRYYASYRVVSASNFISAFFVPKSHSKTV